MKYFKLFLYLQLVLLSCKSTQKTTKLEINSMPELVFVKGGTFIIGNDSCKFDGNFFYTENLKDTLFVNDYYIGKYEITNYQFCVFLNEIGNQMDSSGNPWIEINKKYNSKRNIYKKYDNIYGVKTKYQNYPVGWVSWYGADAYCKWLSSKTGKKYRLPTEAEWEYAARSGGKDYLYSWGNETNGNKIEGNIADICYDKTILNIKDGYKYQAPIGSFAPNEIGIYDMTGNVNEWCNDWFLLLKCSSSMEQDGLIRFGKVIKGGDFSSPMYRAKCSIKEVDMLSKRGERTGFRIVMEAN